MNSKYDYTMCSQCKHGKISTGSHNGIVIIMCEAYHDLTKARNNNCFVKREGDNTNESKP